jgi:hypothetical protein
MEPIFSERRLLNLEPSDPSAVPPGRASFLTQNQALRTWLLSRCPSAVRLLSFSPLGMKQRKGEISQILQWDMIGAAFQLSFTEQVVHLRQRFVN